MRLKIKKKKNQKIKIKKMKKMKIKIKKKKILKKILIWIKWKLMKIYSNVQYVK